MPAGGFADVRTVQSRAAPDNSAPAQSAVEQHATIRTDPMQSLDDLHTFYVVVESRGFTAAARRLELTTSAISRSVRRLEAQVGGALLVRSTRSVALTDLGREVYAQGAQVALAAREVAAIAAGHTGRPQGVLRVSAPIAFGMTWLTPRLHGFNDEWPEVQLELNLSDELVNLHSDRCDVALRISRRIADGLVARPLLPFDFWLVASVDYLADHGTPEHPQELFDHPVMCLGQAGYGIELALERRGEVVSGLAGGRFRANNSIALVQAALARAGIALVPSFVAAEPVRAGFLRRLLADWRLQPPYASSAVQLVYAPTRHVPPKTRAFIDYLVGLADAPAAS